ncbi:hypothetical protein [Ruegeria atlantica]|uniref:Uncharacterized protein n=1 Tax=Ruegeria atlantica TaxID=81569 RepID=A0A0P1EN45_9RHOB|nr:hypothetical protein [Ruegeria atlantica]CUH41448.1 hypothetical protein RUM4293_00320 [Ruegeria atlantica]
MTKTFRRSYQSFSFLFVLNWDFLLFFGATALAIGGWAVVVSM